MMRDSKTGQVQITGLSHLKHSEQLLFKVTTMLLINGYKTN